MRSPAEVSALLERNYGLARYVAVHASLPRPAVFDRKDAETVAATALARALHTWDGRRSLSWYAFPPMRAAVRREAAAHASVTYAPTPRTGQTLAQRLQSFGLTETDIDLEARLAVDHEHTPSPCRAAEREEFWRIARSVCRDDVDLAILDGLARGSTYAMMAEDSGVSTFTVHARLQRLRPALARVLSAFLTPGARFG